MDIRIEKTDRAIEKAFMELRARQPLEKITRDTERDNYMTAQQAKEYGLIDDILYKH